MTIRVSWGTGIAVAYTTFALATLGFVAFAMTKPVDLVSRDYYAESLRHDARTAALARADALVPAFELRLDPVAKHVVLAWPSHLAERLDGTVTLYRPSDAALDVTLPLQPDADGRMRLSVAGMAQGRWQVQVAWEADGASYLAVRDVYVP